MSLKGAHSLLLLFPIGLALVPRAHACATCFGEASSAQTHGMNMAIATLLGVTGLVVGTMAVVTVPVLLRMRASGEDEPESDAGEPV